MSASRATTVGNPPDPAIRFNTGPFGYEAGDAIPAQGFVSTASAIDYRRSRLPVAGQTVFEEVTNASGLHVSTNAGQTVVASASLTVQPAPQLGPAVARAMSSRFENHASASTALQHRFWNSQPVVIAGQTYEPDFFYLQHGRSGVAESAWFETWTAADNKPVDIKLALDGHLGRNGCSGGPCLVSTPTGTDSSRVDDHVLRLDARFVVFDLDTLIICESHDDCGTEGVGHPLPLVTLTARFSGHGVLPFDFMDEWLLSFDTIAGHRYMVMGEVEVEAGNGGSIDFFNTMRITDIDVQPGVLFSDATRQDVASLFGPDVGAVPAPATLWLLLLGGGAAACSRRRLQHDRARRSSGPASA